MYQFELLTNFNIKKTNQNSSSSRTATTYPEPEFSYNDVLQDELFRTFRQHKRNNSNNSRNNTTSNDNANFNSSSSRSVPSSHDTGFISPSNYPSNYSTGLTPTSNFSYDKESLMDWIKKLIEEKTVTKGDANGDGVVDLNDLKTMVDRMFDDTVDIKMKNVDFDGDGKISLQDISKVIDILLERGESDDPVEPIPPPKEILKGDVNGDGKITQADVYTLNQYYVGNTKDINMDNADMNDDGKISLLDIGKLQNLVNELNPNMGDVDGDGKITQKDVEILKNYILDYDVKINMDNSDMNGNGKITMADVTEVQRLADIHDPQVLKGDANGDGKVNYRDVKAIELAEINLGGKIDRRAADMDDDGDITSVDVSKAKKLANEYESKFQKIVGDSNGDGVVDERDYNNVKNYINNVDSSEDFVLKNSDINGDGQVDDEDLKRLRDLADGLKINYSERTNLGDANGDGIISIADVQSVNNYKNRRATGKEFYINNADVNGDGKIDEKDSTAILELLRNVETVRRELPVWSNVELTNQNGDIVRPGDNVIFLERENDSYKIQYKTASGEEKIGWVHRFVFDPVYEPWEATALREVAAYTDSTLSSTSRIGNERVDVGDKVTVLDETDNAYKVEYPTSKGSKIRWVSKDIFKKTDILPVPLFKQYDSRWKNIKIGTKTISQVGCLITSLAMKYSYQSGNTTYPDQMRFMLNFDNNSLYWNSLNQFGYKRQQISSLNDNTLKTIYEKVSQGIPVIIGGTGKNQHWVTITGYTGNPSEGFDPSKFTVNDPGVGSCTNLKQFVNTHPTLHAIIY